MPRLKNKVALVTGAAQGIGAGIAAMFAGEGAELIATDLAAIQVPGARHELELDVSKEAHWEVAARFVEAEFGRLDILVNNAGIECVLKLEELTLEQWRRVMAVNLDGAFLGCKSMLPMLRQGAKRCRTGAAIVNISSVAGLVGFPHQAAYNVSKAGVRHLTKSLAIEFAADGLKVRVNSIHPGCIRTPMLEGAVRALTQSGGLGDGNDAWAEVAALHPLNRIGTVEDIAQAAVYLASDEAGFVTGVELPIDGGWTAR